MYVNPLTMRRDSIFWLCMIFSFFLLFLLVFYKPYIHTLHNWMMYFLIKLQLLIQVFVGLFACWVSIDSKLFKGFAQLYGVLIVIYILLKLPFLQFLNPYFIVVPSMFTPLPFVGVWLINKSFYKKSG